MASSRRRKGKRLAIPEKTPGFFKVVLNEALQDGRLEIEGFVAIKYRNFLARSVLLKVPNGEIWPVKLTRSDGSTWLQKGWPELADFYSLEQGYFLFVGYEGDDSCFQQIPTFFANKYICTRGSARDNRLQVGDAVVIEMIEQPKITYEVHIYRA